MDERAARRQAEAEQARLDAQEREDVRLRTEAAALRKESIEAMQKTGGKRKVRVDDLDVIPRPGPGIFGISDEYIFGEEVTEEQLIKDGISIPSAKRAKLSSDDSPARKRAWATTSLGDVSPISKTPTQTLTADPHRAQPYTGTMFADSPTKKSGEKVVKDKTPAARKARHDFREEKWHGKNRGFRAMSGYGLAYDSTDDDSTDDDELDDATPNEDAAHNDDAAQNDDATLSDSDNDSLFNEKVSPDETDNAAPKTPERVNVFSGRSVNDDNTATSKAPPSPTMPHATLPGFSTSNDQNGSAALAKARSEAEKYKPKTPSGLRATSRLSSSPAFAMDSPSRGPAPPAFTPASQSYIPPPSTSLCTIQPSTYSILPSYILSIQ